MKLVRTFTLALLLVGPLAHASKARLLSLGQDADGSYFLSDTRNIFLNPAKINNYASFADFEFGSATPATGTTLIGRTSNPGNTAPNAEGGYFAGDNFKWGIQLGKVGMGTSIIQNANIYDNITTANAFIFPNNAAELVGGGNAGSLKWGAALLYGSASANTASDASGAGYPQKNSNTISVRGGLMQDRWEAHLNLNLLTTAKTQVSATESYEYKHTMGASAGGSFKWDPQWTAFAQIDQTPYKVDHITAGTTVTNDDTDLGYRMGVARVMALEAKNFFYYSLALAGQNFKTSTGGNDVQKEQRVYLPLGMGLEYGLAPWAVLRASVTQNLIVSQETQKLTPGSEVGNVSTYNTTVATLGVGFTFQKVVLDATFTGSTNGNFDAVNMLANLGATYTF